ncbi:ABC transporter ATP-binding protein [Rubrimonas cliftonensis]|uniref:Iron complex transport system ATP-binding protein n=1 Tax=Rubrimonas cliftonensis TaxID=89524 RepID=A0A1H4EIR1_9RHOB|nr:ABC transporter ATP-binding protein [Rubrimonas cliftonensis]SEA84588.1 iron complex transport system ATP-binding protein [Rubrimonas cliftonensis]
MSLLALEGLSVSLGGRRVVDGVSLAVAPGDFVGLIGPNGAGKSTLMRAALGLLPAAGGRRLGGEDVARLSPPERARRAAWLPQEREIAWPVSVQTLVGLGRAPWRRPGAAFSEADRAAVADAMARADVARFADRPATALSGGERARVLIARALAQAAPLVMADEPAAGLDPAHQIALMETFSALAAEGRGVVASMHDLGLAARWCGRLALLDAGRLVAFGPPAEVLTEARLAAVYGVRCRLDWIEGAPSVTPLGRTAKDAPATLELSGPAAPGGS